MFGTAIIMALASVSPIIGGLGFKLMEPATAQVKDCGTPSQHGDDVLYVCEGDQFFDPVIVHSTRGVITAIAGSRHYSGTNANGARDVCFKDLLTVLKTIDRRYPTLQQGTPKNAFQAIRTDKVSAGLTLGRVIALECASYEDDGRGSATLWLRYRYSVDEFSNLKTQSDLEKLRRKGFEPERL